MNNLPQSLSAWPFHSKWQECYFSSTVYELPNRNSPMPEGFTKRTLEFQAGRAAAKQALAQCMPNPEEPARDPDSKLPKWPEGITGSISHSHGLAVATVAPTSHWVGLGVDVERLIPENRAMRLQHAILHADEASLDEWSLHEQLTCIFSAKESLFKLLNPITGSYFGFLDAKMTEIDSQGNFSLSLLKDLSNEWPIGSRVQGQWARFNEGYITLAGLAASR